MRNSPLRAFANGDKEKKEVKYDLSKATITENGKKVKKEKSSFDSYFTPVDQADLPKPKPKRRKK